MSRRLIQPIARILLILATALWLGGLVALFIFVSALFGRDRSVANLAAPMLFDAFDLYQRGLAVVSLLLAALLLWRRQAFASWLVFSLILLSTAAAATMAFYVMPEIRGLMAENLARRDRFEAMHGLSMQIYVAETIMLLVVLLALSVWRPRAEERQAPPP